MNDQRLPAFHVAPGSYWRWPRWTSRHLGCLRDDQGIPEARARVFVGTSAAESSVRWVWIEVFAKTWFV